MKIAFPEYGHSMIKKNPHLNPEKFYVKDCERNLLIDKEFDSHYQAEEAAWEYNIKFNPQIIYVPKDSHCPMDPRHDARECNCRETTY